MIKSADRSKKGKRAVAKDAVRKPDWVREIEEACDKGVKSAMRKLRAEERKQLKFAANHSVKFENVAEVAEALRIYADLVNRGSLIPSDHDLTDYAKRFEDAHRRCVFECRRRVNRIIGEMNGKFRASCRAVGIERVAYWAKELENAVESLSRPKAKENTI